MYVWFVCFAPNVALVQLFIQTIIWMPPQQKKKVREDMATGHFTASAYIFGTPI